MNFPLEILQSQVYNSIEAHKALQSPVREVDCYEIELCTALLSEGVISFIDGTGRPLCVGDITVAHPGQKRCTRGHYECLFVFFQCHDGEFAEKYLLSLPSILHLGDDAGLVKLFSSVAIALAKKEEGYELYAEGRMLQLISVIYSAGSLLGGFEEKYIRFSGSIMQAMDYMRAHFSENITLEDVAGAVHISPSYFHMIFKRSVGQTPARYLSDVRIREAQKLLLTTSMSLSQVAEVCGFDSQSYFTDVFRRRTGSTPAKYRRDNAAVL